MMFNLIENAWSLYSWGLPDEVYRKVHRGCWGISNCVVADRRVFLFAVLLSWCTSSGQLLWQLLLHLSSTTVGFRWLTRKSFLLMHTKELFPVLRANMHMPQELRFCVAIPQQWCGLGVTTRCKGSMWRSVIWRACRTKIDLCSRTCCSSLLWMGLSDVIFPDESISCLRVLTY